MSGKISPALDLIENGCPDELEDLPHWFRSISDEELKAVWCSAVTSLVLETAPGLPGASLVLSLLEVRDRLIGFTCATHQKRCRKVE
jgi:hypothetical protein